MTSARGSWLLAGHRREVSVVDAFALPCTLAVLCVNRRLGQPRQMLLPGEIHFSGVAKRGLGGDVNSLRCVGERVIVLGMGAFAFENVRTSFERGAAHVTMLCRRRGTACPQIIDWVNFIRPFDGAFKHDAPGDAIVFNHWRKAYDLSGASRPECWKVEGLLKPDGHTVSTSDMYFIAHHLNMLATRLGEVERLEASRVVTSGDELQVVATVVIKCVGFDLNGGNERLLGRTCMRRNAMVDNGLHLQIEPHLDSRTFNSPFGSSYVHGTAFSAMLMVRYWKRPDLTARLASAEWLTSRINTFSASEGVEGIGELGLADPEVPSLMRAHLAAAAAAFHVTMSPAEYVAENIRLWAGIHELLLHAALETTAPQYLAYPFASPWEELPDVSAVIVKSVGGAAPSLRSRATSVEEVLKATKQVASGTDLNADMSLVGAGLDSFAAVELRTLLEEVTGTALPVSLVFDEPSPRLIAKFLSDGAAAPNEQVSERAASPAASPTSTLQVAEVAPRLRASTIGLDDIFISAGLMCLRPADSGIPLVCVPGAQGHADGWRPLASVVSNPIYGVIHPHLQDPGSTLCDATIEEVADTWTIAVL